MDRFHQRQLDGQPKGQEPEAQGDQHNAYKDVYSPKGRMATPDETTEKSNFVRSLYPKDEERQNLAYRYLNFKDGVSGYHKLSDSEMAKIKDKKPELDLDSDLRALKRRELDERLGLPHVTLH